MCACRNPPQRAGAGGPVQLQTVPLQKPLHQGLAHPPPQVCVLVLIPIGVFPPLRFWSVCGWCWSFSFALLWCSWASSDDVWISMLNKELKYFHDSSYLQRHPRLQPKMRAILLDWLLEVRAELSSPPTLNLCVAVGNQACLCAGERGVQPPPADGLPGAGLLRPLHADAGGREQGASAAAGHHGALHRLQDGGESWPPRAPTLRLQQLQTRNQKLSAPQEIYPPKICEFAYVTDGACDMWDIQQTELLMLKVRARYGCSHGAVCGGS